MAHPETIRASSPAIRRLAEAEGLDPNSLSKKTLARLRKIVTDETASGSFFAPPRGPSGIFRSGGAGRKAAD